MNAKQAAWGTPQRGRKTSEEMNLSRGMQRISGAYRLESMELVRYMLSHTLAGCLAGALAAAVTVATNSSLRELMLNEQNGWLAFALLTFGFVTTFGSVAMAHGVMRIGEDP
jgi:hypothetical protein